MIARQDYGRRLPDRDGEHAHARCFLHLFSAGGNTAGRFDVPSCTASPASAHALGHVAGTHIDAPGGRATLTLKPGDENVDRDEICALRRNCSRHRRYSVGCDQETENDSLSQRLTRSDVRSAPSPASQPIQSCSHRRWYPWLQSNARALLTKKWVRDAVTSGAVTMATNDPNSAACKHHAGQTSDSDCARSSRRSRRGSGAG